MAISSRWLTQATLRRDASAAALWQALAPTDNAQRVKSTHHLLWTLFADSADRDRDFLWREERPGSYMLLSSRPPTDAHNLFDLSESKEFAPALSAGERLRFLLRVNATVARGGGPGVRGKPVDVVMSALHGVPTLERARVRPTLLEPAATSWLEARADRAGFALLGVVVRSYDTLQIDRGRGSKPAKLGVLDLEGELQVTAPDPFIAAVTSGFGRGKGFGNGLMLIRRP